MTTTDNLWPEFSLDEVIRTPKMILNEQAEFLAKGTKNLLTGKIKSYVNEYDVITHEFNIVVPNLNGYQYKLFTVTHESVLIYPCTLEENDREWTEIEDENEFLDILKNIFNSADTKRIIQSLVSQSKDNTKVKF